MTTQTTVTAAVSRADRATVARRSTAPSGRFAAPAGPDTARARSVRRAMEAFDVITPLGWSVLAIGMTAWIAGAALGWDELLIGAAMCLIVVVIAVGFVLSRVTLRIGVELDPPRLVAGERALGRVRFSNDAGWRTLPTEVELPVGTAVATFRAPMLAPGAATEEVFVIPTEHRGVIPVGPPTAVRSDPLGLLTRRAVCGESAELLVHPRTIPLPSFGAGLLRDLEGLTTKDVSPSDLAFHSLREYVPGDDRRFIHWRSYARTGKLQVRQFNDTRRSSLCVVVDADAAGYADPNEFEIALQAAGSMVRRATADGLRVSFFCGGQQASATTAFLLLDAMARAELRGGGHDLAHDAARAARHGGDLTLALLFSGSNIPAVEIHRAARWFPTEVRSVGVRIVAGAPWGVGSAGRTTLLQIGTLTDLVAAVSAGAIR